MIKANNYEKKRRFQVILHAKMNPQLLISTARREGCAVRHAKP
jgi:hypothetical protein